MKTQRFVFPFSIHHSGFIFQGRCLADYTPGEPAYISGPPEDCYEGSDPQVELITGTVVSLNGVPMGWLTIAPSQFLEHYRDELYDQALSYIEDQQEIPYDA